MRFVVVIATAAVLTIANGPLSSPAAAGRAGFSQDVSKDGAWEASAARKKARKKKAAPKEQYLRAVPSAPPPGTKK
jgi:hypothetical protein